MSRRGERFGCVGSSAAGAKPIHVNERICMTGWKLTAAKLAAMVGLLIAGIGVSAAFADPGNGNGPPTTNPGSPGDDCSHGNSGDDCRPDPNQNGKDCEDHGNASGNEDHCDQAGTTTTDTTSTTETTTTDETTTSQTTTSTTTKTGTTPTTTTNPRPPGTPPASPGNDGSSADSGPSSSNPPVTVTKPGLQKQLGHQVKSVRATRVSRGSSKPGELPFTGFPAWALALIGSVLLTAGLGLRKLAS
jgi:hypothetical protein